MKLFIVLLSIFLLLGCTINLGQPTDKKDTPLDGKKTPSPPPSPTPSLTPTPQSPPPVVGPTPTPPTATSIEVYINNKKLTSTDIELLTQTYGSPPAKGRYWYDTTSGLFGVEGREAAGFLYPDHDFREMAADASNGNTGVFINGRELPLIELQFYYQIFGQVYPGKYWLDANGYIGLEGDSNPLANLVLAMQQAQQQGGGSGSSGGDGSYYYSGGPGYSGGVSDGCVYVNVPGGSAWGSGC